MIKKLCWFLLFNVNTNLFVEKYIFYVYIAMEIIHYERSDIDGDNNTDL